MYTGLIDSNHGVCRFHKQPKNIVREEDVALTEMASFFKVLICACVTEIHILSRKRFLQNAQMTIGTGHESKD